MVNVPESVALPMPLIVTYATKESSVWTGLVLITLVPVTFEPLSSKNGAPRIVSSVPLVLLRDEVARGIVCANILGIAMNPNTIAMVVAVYIPILNMHMAL